MGQWLSDHLGQTFVIENIARELGVDPKTLQKHFGEVIETAAARRKMDDLAALSERARGGSARAVIKLIRMTKRADHAERG